MFYELKYWDDWYESHTELFDWYVQLPVFFTHIQKHFHPDKNILVLGAGVSRLPYQLYDLGYKNVTCIDFSAGAKKNMEGELRKRPGMVYIVRDVAELNKSLFDHLFDIVIDKGLLDCLLTNSFEPLTAMKQAIETVYQIMSPKSMWFTLSFDGIDRQEMLEYCTSKTFVVSKPYKVIPPALEISIQTMPTFYLYKLEHMPAASATLTAQ